MNGAIGSIRRTQQETEGQECSEQRISEQATFKGLGSATQLKYIIEHVLATTSQEVKRNR